MSKGAYLLTYQLPNISILFCIKELILTLLKKVLDNNMLLSTCYNRK